MSTILLPAVRRDTANLYPFQHAGAVNEATVNVAAWPGGAYLPLVSAGLKVGDTVSASLEVLNETPSENVRMELRFHSAADSSSIVSTAVAPYIDTQTFTRQVIENQTIPAGTTHIRLAFRRESGAGTHAARKGMVNRGGSAAPHEWPKRGAWAPITHGQLVRDNEQFMQRYLSGASQITTFPSRRWLLQFATHILEGDELREWSLALDRLSDLTNVFHFVPPEYTGPSTGYEGPLPVVNGAGQLGTSLDCNGVTPETDIVGPGDYVSFPVTTSAGETNYELHRISSLCTSDESGEVTLEFTRPIRLAPANNAVVQIYSPIGQFRLAVPRAGQDIQLLRRASVSVEAEEAIWL